MASKRQANTGRPFHRELLRLRETGFIDPATIAGDAGVTIRVYRAMELGEIPVTGSVYDAALRRFPQLKAHPRPSVNPTPTARVQHPAVVLDNARVDPLVQRVKRLNVGSTNRGIVRELLRIILENDLTLEDVERYL